MTAPMMDTAAPQGDAPGGDEGGIMALLQKLMAMIALKEGGAPAGLAMMGGDAGEGAAPGAPPAGGPPGAPGGDTGGLAALLEKLKAKQGAGAPPADAGPAVASKGGY